MTKNNEQILRELVSEGLNLTVRSDVMENAEKMPPLWFFDQYNKDLVEWQVKARAALATVPDAAQPDQLRAKLAEERRVNAQLRRIIQEYET